MSITLAQTTGNILPEYAATNTSFNRQMVPDANGHFQPQFNGNLNYQRTDYLVDANGNKIGIIQHVPPAQVPGQPYLQDPYFGNISLNQEQLAGMEGAIPTTGLLTAIAVDEDALIQADLVARGIMAAPAA